MASAAPGHKGDREARERRRKKGGVVRRPSEELAGAGRRRTGAGDGGVRRGGAKSLNLLKLKMKRNLWKRKRNDMVEIHSHISGS
ncbi:hypothetical protein CFC21_034760 [Triticum aestivum]|uniref:Uncharacterized protein n=3 Tax=Triticum TaxID=4564 RepID=A0A9R0RGC1_TRITD|nr:hypothetical protein CFC21_034760 [Triticum aestivum]VAH59162.1 unnamed protein product [Triticum turgidum subsp. durum]